MTFNYPALLWLLALLPIAAALLWRAERRREGRALAYADAHLQGAVLRRASERGPLVLQLGALALLLFGAAQPEVKVPRPVNKAAVMIALDVSRSMLADDAQPTRLEAARTLAKEFVRAAPGSASIGFMTFSEGAAVLVPPTTDRESVLAALDRAKPAQATSFAGALVGGVRALPGRRGAEVPRELLDGPGSPLPSTPNPNAQPIDRATLPPGAILLLTDGVSNRGGNPLVAARFASDHKVKLHAVALGKTGGAVTRVEGQLVFVPFDTRELERLTQLTDGTFVYPPDPEKLRALYRDLGTVVVWEPARTDLGAPFAGLAVVLLLAGGGWALASQRRVP